MSTLERTNSGSATHEVTNQPPPLADYNVFDASPVIGESLAAFDAGAARGALRELGTRAGSEQTILWGFEANRNPPQLKTFDRFGRRIDEVEYHPAYHALMHVAAANGLHAAPWRDARAGAHVARAAGFFLWGQAEAGHLCPISMTHASLPVLRMQPDLARVWEPGVLAFEYDPVLRPPAEKRGLLIGMAMTEKQGGSDVRANTTRALPVGAGGPGAEYRLRGHKWFCSAPMSDAFLVLAQAPAGLSCFLVPRVLPDGERNAFAIQRLKDKLGNRANASSEIELDGTLGYLIGEEGRGVRTIVEMVNFTRLDCIIGSAAGMRQATAQAAHHMAHRTAFGTLLSEAPAAQNVLADLEIETEGAELLFLRLAQACDRAPFDPQEAALKRIGTALGKYWVCKRAAVHAAEALECLGGNGYVEESVMPRIYREAPLNSIWEGSGNVNALDIVRILTKEPAALDAWLAQIDAARGSDRRFDAARERVQSELRDPADRERRARRIVEGMALLLQGSLLLRFGTAAVADAFCASRLAGDWGHAFGTLPRDAGFKAIVARAIPPR